MGVRIRPHRGLAAVLPQEAALRCVYTGMQENIPADAVVLVTAKLPNEALYLELLSRKAEWVAAGVKSVTSIGDALAPAPIAAAVYAGHKFARGLDAPEDVGDVVPFLREVAHLAPWKPATAL